MLEEPPVNDKIHIEVMSKRRGFNFHAKVGKNDTMEFCLYFLWVFGNGLDLTQVGFSKSCSSRFSKF